jgi:polo-like kinase 1
MASSQRKQKPVLKEVPDRVIDSTKNKAYTKGKFLGKGGFARCYELIDNKTKRIYAGKVISKTMLIKKSQREKVNL